MAVRSMTTNKGLSESGAAGSTSPAARTVAGRRRSSSVVGRFLKHESKRGRARGSDTHPAG